MRGEPRRAGFRREQGREIDHFLASVPKEEGGGGGGWFFFFVL